MAGTCFSQQVQTKTEQVDITLKADINYIVVQYQHKLKSKNAVFVDVGDKDWKTNYFINEQGTKINFQSIIDLFNYLDKYGWDYKNNLYSETQGTDVMLFKRKVTL